jgi:general secretion pathway protein I
MSRRPARIVTGKAAGFTLLEAVVALTLFSLVGLALFSWLTTNLIALERVDAKQQELAEVRNALALLETVNPLLEPTGSREFGSLRVNWTSEPIVERRNGKGPSGGLSVFDLALFRMQVEVAREGVATTEFSVTRAGWEVVRAADPEDN